MHGVAKALLKSASVIAVLSGGLLLLPSPASAQLPFPNIQFRVPYVGGGGGGSGSGHYRTRHHKAHERKHGDPDEDEPAEHEKSAPQPMSAPIKDTPPPPPPQSGGSSGGSGPPKPAGGDEPTFSPSR